MGLTFPLFPFPCTKIPVSVNAALEESPSVVVGRHKQVETSSLSSQSSQTHFRQDVLKEPEDGWKILIK